MRKFWLAFAVSTIFALGGCATAAWNKYPIKAPPDYTCRIGGPGAGTTYYIWKCLGDKRVVVGQTSFVFGSTSAKKYESSCGILTEIENNVNLNPDHDNCRILGRWKTEGN